MSMTCKRCGGTGLEPWSLIEVVCCSVELVSEANKGGKRKDKIARKTRVKECVTATLWRTGRMYGPELLRKHAPLRVVITRMAPRSLDDDNAARAAKSVRDAVAAWLGVDDGNRKLVVWEVEQEKQKLPMVKIAFYRRGELL